MENKFERIIIFALVVLNIAVWPSVYYLNNSKLEVVFFDVGQGDSIFIKIPSGYQILIDGGPDSTLLEKIGSEMPFWDRTIDLIILTHPDHDHIFGLLEVLERYKVDNILWTGILSEGGEYEQWLDSISKEGAEITIAESGQKIEVGDAKIDILFPFKSLEGENVSDANNTSAVARLVFGQTSFLFMGDAYKSTERLLKDIDSDVLKIGHHGSKTSSDANFISLVSPDIAVISCGKDNSYGHPHQETLNALLDIEVLRTDLMGDIKIISDGNIIEVD
jgi:competence protein ComEC